MNKGIVMLLFIAIVFGLGIVAVCIDSLRQRVTRLEMSSADSGGREERERTMIMAVKILWSAAFGAVGSFLVIGGLYGLWKSGNGDALVGLFMLVLGGCGIGLARLPWKEFEEPQ